MMKKGNVNVPFGKADLAAIILASVPMTWQNQYNINHTTVLEATHALLPDLEAIEQVMVEKQTRSSRQRVSLLQPGLKPREIQSARHLGAQLVKSLKRVAARSFASIAKPMTVPSRPKTPWTAIAMTAMASPLWQQQVSPLSP